MSLTVFIYSSLTVALTSAVPLLIFLSVGSLLLKSSHHSIILSGLVSLAAGSLLGDVLFHLIPEIFNLHGDYLRNCALILTGVFVFFVGERVLQHYHHGHGHSHMALNNPSDISFLTGTITGGSPAAVDELELEQLNRTPLNNSPKNPDEDRSTVLGAKPVGLLVLTSDFIHNFVDGIALGVSFATSPSVGFSTAVAVFLHEIPHELGDFAILLAAGYSPLTIVICNMLTTLSSFLGVGVAILLMAMNKDDIGTGPNYGSFSTTIKPAILSLTAGNFLYIALADLIPELLHGHHQAETSSKWLLLVQYVAFLAGATSMLIIKLISD